MKIIQALGLLLAVAATQSNATVITFNDRATFLAGISGATTIDFGGIASNSTFILFSSSAGLTLSGVNFVGITGPDNILGVVDSQFCCAAYRQRGGQVASLASPFTGGNPHIDVSLPSGINAFGMDLFTVINGNGSGSDTDTVQIIAGAQTFLVPTVPTNVGNGRVFFGLISSEAISSFSVAPTAINAEANVVNFTFGVAPVSLPGAVLLLGSALGGLGLMRRRVT